MAETTNITAARLAAFIAQNYTDIETGPGSVINELLIKLAATIQNEQYNTIEAINQGATIKQVLAATEDSYSPVVDLIASNYNTTRSTGKKVTGKIKITLSSASDYNFRAGLTFTQPALNLNYILTSGVRVSSQPDEALKEIQLYRDQGFYYFILDVEAAEAGPEYQTSSGTVFALATDYFINSFVKAEAYGNFASGEAVETDKQLIAKIKSNLGNSRLESAAGIAKNFKTFAGFQSLSICGANDAEMLRSKQNALGISTFGKADVYVRSSVGPETRQLQKEATKVSENSWIMHINNYEAPGFYTINSIIPAATSISLGGTLIPTSVVYGKAFYTNQRNNELHSVVDARFTKYQTATVTFTYNDIPAIPVGSNAAFIVQTACQPNILEMQDLMLSDEYRLACADYLVKAVIPCFVSLDIKLIKKRSTDTFESLNLQNLKKDLFTYINTIPFGGELHASNIVDICHNYDIKRVDLPITMIGNILCPDGSTITVQDSDVLAIPYNLSKGVTPKTSLYFIDYYRVAAGVAHPIDNIGLNIA